MDHPSELTPQQRAALITVRLIRGERLTNAAVAEICGYMDWNSAQYLMDSLSIILPIQKINGVWFCALSDIPTMVLVGVCYSDGSKYGC